MASGIITEGAGSAAPSPAPEALAWIESVTRDAHDAEYAPNRYAPEARPWRVWESFALSGAWENVLTERGGVTVDAALALLAPIFLAVLVVALAVLAH